MFGGSDIDSGGLLGQPVRPEALVLPGLHSSVTAFAPGEQVEPLDPGDAGERLEGFRSSTRMWKSASGSLDVTSGWLRNESPKAGALALHFGGAAPETGGAGAAWASGARASLLRERLSLYGEYARSDTAFDAEEGAVNTEADSAYRVGFELRSPQQLGPRGRPATWTLAAEDRRIGTWFRIPGDPGAAADTRAIELRGSASWAGLDLDALLSRSHDNANDLEDRARVRTQTGRLNLSFSPAPLFGAERPRALRWLGLPVLDGAYAVERDDVVSDPNGLADLGKLPEGRTRTLSGELSFERDELIWGLRHEHASHEGSLVVGDDRRDRLTEVFARFAPARWLALRPSLSFIDVARPGESGRAVWAAGLGAELEGLAPALDGRIDLTWQRRREHGFDELRALALEGSLSWQARRAASQRTGVALSVDGSFRTGDAELDSGTEERDYRVFLRVTVTLPGSGS